MNKNVVTYELEFNSLVSSLIDQINESGFSPDIVVGVSRGGVLPAVVLSHAFKVPFQTLHWSKEPATVGDMELGNESNMWLPHLSTTGVNILIVDDLCDTGRTMQEIMDDWDTASGDTELDWGGAIRTACLQKRYTSDVTPDYSVQTINNGDPVVYPWEHLT